MGQKASSLGSVLRWKHSADPSRNGGADPSVVGHDDPQPTASAVPAAAGSSCAITNCSAPMSDQQRLYENVCPSHTTDGSSSLPQPTEVAAVVETTTKNTQTSSKGVTGLKKHWVLRFNCARPKSKNSPKNSAVAPPETAPEPDAAPTTSTATTTTMTNDVDTFEACVCTRYRRTEDHLGAAGMAFDCASSDAQVYENDDYDNGSINEAIDYNDAFNAFSAFNAHHHSQLVLPSFDEGVMELNSDISGEFMTDDIEDRAYKERAKEIQEGIEPPPGFRPGLQIQLVEFNLPKLTIDSLTSLFHRAAVTAAMTTPQDTDDSHRIHTSIDYIHYLVPDLLQITNCSFYWGKMDRYEAEKLLENKPEGTFLLRDSAQEEYLFSVSFRKYGRSLHARIEQWNHLFSFDSRDPGVYASKTVCGLIEHYKDPSCCMFFEPMLTIPLHRNFTFSLQHTSRAAVCSQLTYDDVNQLKLPKLLKAYLKEYHYKQRVRVRIFDSEN